MFFSSASLIDGIRYAELSDIEAIYSVLLSHHFELGDVSRRAILNGIERRNVILHADSGAFCRFYGKSPTHISEICVPEKHRGLGIATKLLKSLPVPIKLTCRADNPANEFYRKIGFKFLGSKELKKWTSNIWYLQRWP